MMAASRWMVNLVVTPACSENRQDAEMNRSCSEAVLPAKPDQDHPGAAEYLLDLLTVEEIAAALRVAPSWVYERVRKRGKDKMPHLKVGKYLRFRLNEVRVWVDQGAAR